MTRTLPSPFLSLGGIALLFAIAQGTAQAAEPSDFLFVGDLRTGTLFRYGAENINGTLAFTPYGLNGNTTDPAYIANQGVTEGVHGTGNTLITSQKIGNDFRISRFDRATGAFISFVSPQVFAGIGNLALTNDATTTYVPDESGNRLYRVDVATGNILSSAAMTGVHDVQIGADGFIYATAYSGNSGVRRYTADLSSFAQIVAPGNNGLTRPAGVVVSGNTLYVAQNSQTVNAKVYKYTINGNNTATYDTQVTSSLLSFSFGMEQGPDNNLYVAIPGTFTGQGGPNQIAKLDLTNGFSQANTVVTTAILYPGVNSSPTYTSTASNVIWPKYIKFSSNFAQANDPGVAIVVPETGSIVLLLTGGLPLVGMVLRRRKLTGV
ncbi:MAG: hypothetical protein H7145_03275 [Akkermansiaceae bacterium]|nr:hypothetical protein [Armatimonadota bacterium]